jgi:hypothetical protein
MNRREIFEYCLYELLERHKSVVLLERTEEYKIDSLEWAMSADFLSAMERLEVLKFEQEKNTKQEEQKESE